MTAKETIDLCEDFLERLLYTNVLCYDARYHMSSQVERGYKLIRDLRLRSLPTSAFRFTKVSSAVGHQNRSPSSIHTANTCHNKDLSRWSYAWTPLIVTQAQVCAGATEEL